MHTFLEECGKYEPKAPNILYHYCSVDTMLKIMQNYCNGYQMQRKQMIKAN